MSSTNVRETKDRRSDNADVVLALVGLVYRVPTVPLPNTVVKPIHANDTWVETPWESR